MQVKRKHLIWAAGCMWIIAGVNVFHIGMQVWQVKQRPLLHFAGVFATFLFFAFIFKRAYEKNINRISKMDNPPHPFAFFDLKGWGIIVVMMTLGFSVRHFALMPVSFIAPFYQGLGACLTIYGCRFLWKGAMTAD